MAQQITELTFLKHLAPRYEIPVPEFLEWPTQRNAVHKFLGEYSAAIAKPDILSGGRGKGGAVEKVTSSPEAVKALSRLSNLEFKGRVARTAYLTQFIPAEMEVYTAITYDSKSLSPAVTVSMCGGMDVESIDDKEKVTFPLQVYRGLDAYQAQKILDELKCPKDIISPLSRAMVNLWDMFISTGMRMCEINPWRVTPEKRPVACDFKAVFDPANFKQKNLGFEWPEYPQVISEFEEEMTAWAHSSHQGQAHVSDLGGQGVLPVLFGGGASTIVIETLQKFDGDPMFLSDFGGNPPYERMKGTAEICFRHKLADAGLLLILGGKANNTRIDITFQAIADALRESAHLRGSKKIPVILGRGGPRLVTGMIAMRDALEELEYPYAIFGHDTPITMVAQYAAELYKFLKKHPKDF